MDFVETITSKPSLRRFSANGFNGSARLGRATASQSGLRSAAWRLTAANSNAASSKIDRALEQLSGMDL